MMKSRWDVGQRLGGGEGFEPNDLSLIECYRGGASACNEVIVCERSVITLW